MRLFKEFLCDDDAQDLIEYALLAAFVAVAGYVGLRAIGTTVGSTYQAWLSPDTGVPSLWQPPEPSGS